MATGIKRFSDFTQKDSASIIANSFIVGYDTAGSINDEFRIDLASFYQNPLNPLYTILNSNSSSWINTFTTVYQTSADWQQGVSKSYIHNNFLPLTGGTMTGILSTLNGGSSNDWNSVYTTVYTNSALWTPIGQNAIIGSLSSTIDNNSTGSIIVGGSAVDITGSIYSNTLNSTDVEIVDSKFFAAINAIASSTYQTLCCLMIGAVGSVIEYSKRATLINSEGILISNGSFNTGVYNSTNIQSNATFNSNIIGGTSVVSNNNNNILSINDVGVTLNYNDSVSLLGNQSILVDQCKKVNVFNTDNSYINDTQYSGIYGSRLTNFDNASGSFIFGSVNSLINSASSAYIFGGSNNRTQVNNTYLLGRSLTATRADAVYTNNIINNGTVISNTLSATNNIILKAPNNNLYSITVNNAGSLVTALL